MSTIDLNEDLYLNRRHIAGIMIPQVVYLRNPRTLGSLLLPIQVESTFKARSMNFC